MLLYFRARPKDFGCAFIRFAAPIASVTANVTNTYGLGGISDKDTAHPNVAHTAYVDEIHAGCVTIPIDADGTLLLNIKKYDASAGSAVTISSGFNLESLVAGKVDQIPVNAGVTDSQRILDYGDFLYAEIVSNSAAIDTAMVGGNISVLAKILT